jgi:hypothetical protein
MMQRVAQCCCGALRVEVTGDPASVAACHCGECQRRTGSVFGVVAFFPRDQVRLGAVGTVYERDGQDGRKVRFRFCPACGSTVWWEADLRPGQIGLAVGAFRDPAFPAPAWSVWEEVRHPWVAFAHSLERAQQMPRRAAP